jgi:hypothetical protein
MNTEHAHATWILQLLLTGAPNAPALVELDWEVLLRLAKRNGVLVRLADRLQKATAVPPRFFGEAVEAERRRNREAIALIRKVSRMCAQNGIEFIFAKAFQHYPDMGRDVDLFVWSRAAEVDKLIAGALPASPHKGNLVNWAAGTVKYTVNGCSLPLEVHHGRMGNLGEHSFYVGTLITNARHADIEGTDFLVPSSEDQVVIQGMDKVYGRRYLRLSDIVSTVSIVRWDRLDWGYIIQTAKRLCTLPGLCCYLSYMNQIHGDLFGSDLFSPPRREALDLNGWGRLWFRGGFYRFPTVGVAVRVYWKKFWAALVSRDWQSAARLCLLPPVAAGAVWRRLRRPDMSLHGPMLP